MAQQLTEEQFIDFKRAFILHASKKDECVSTKQLTTVMRSLGMNPTEDEIDNWTRELETDDKKKLRINFSMFANMMLNKLREVDIEEDLRVAFRVFDGDNDGFISAEELRIIMTNLGEKMTDEEVDEMIEVADIDGNGRVDYKEFVALMMPK